MSMYRTMVEYFVSDNWPVTPVEGKPVIRTEYSGENGHLPCIAFANEDVGLFSFAVVLPFNVSKDQMTEAALLTARLNNQATIGRFLLDLETGQVSFRQTIEAYGDELTAKMVKNAVMACYTLADAHCASFRDLVLEGQSRSMPTAHNYLEEGTRLRKLGDNDKAIVAYDTCLCSDPDPVTEMIAWDGMVKAIMFKFMFMERKGETISNEEFRWHHRLFMSMQNEVKVFEEKIAHTPAASNYIRPIEGAKDQLKTIYLYGMSVQSFIGGALTYRIRDLAECADVVIPPLQCLAQQEAEEMSKWRQGESTAASGEERAFCENCGTRIKSGDKFCGGCGTRL